MTVSNFRKQLALWPHTSQCIRIRYALDEGTVEQGIAILAKEVKEAHTK